jgi:membrane-bound hydrogenase subunit mbhJ
MNAGSCNGCDIELIASLTPRYDAEQLGVRLEGSPRHADILCITGPVTHNSVQAIKTVYGQVCGPKAVVAIGSCPATTNVFIDSRTVDGPLNKHIPVDVFVPGCPPRPDAIILGIAKAAGILAERGAQKQAAAALAPTAPEAAALLTAAPEAIPTVPASAEPATPELVTVAAAAREVQP